MEDNILDKLEEKLRSILSLRIKIDLSQHYKDFDPDFEINYIQSRLDELMLDVDDLVDQAKDDIKAEIEMEIELAYDAKELAEDLADQDNYWS